jgi:hypothetical protein
MKKSTAARPEASSMFVLQDEFARLTAQPLQDVLDDLMAGRIPFLLGKNGFMIPRRFVDALVERALRYREQDRMARELAVRLAKSETKLSSGKERSASDSSFIVDTPKGPTTTGQDR